MSIKAIGTWRTNGELIADVARLGYISEDSYTLDPTYGLGNWWTHFRPHQLVTHDLKLDGVDFRRLPHQDETFDVVAYDPPYKLNGTPTPEVDDRYGVGEPTHWQDRLILMQVGLKECLRVVRRRGYVLAKCQDQVCSGRVVWQTAMMADAAFDYGAAAWVDHLLMPGGRPQPAGRRQVHAHRNYSSLLVFRKV